MAQKFNDGQTFGSIREILNGNADELSSTTDTANAANATAEEAIKVANSFDTAPYVAYGRVFAPSASERGNKGKDNGSLWFNGGKAYTIDYVLPGGVSLYNQLMSITNKGDISVAISGSYTDGWKGSAEQTYHGVARVHYVEVTNYVAIEAVDTETAEMYVISNDTVNWTKVNGGASGTAGGDLTGTYPNPTVKSSIHLPGSPTTTTQDQGDQSSKIASTAFVSLNSEYDLKPAVCGCLDTMVVAFGIPNNSIKAVFKNESGIPLMLMVLFDGTYLYPAFVGQYRAVNALIVDDVRVNSDDVRKLRNNLGNILGIYVYRGRLFTADACFYYPGSVPAGTMRGGFPINSVGLFLSDVTSGQYYL